MVDKACDTVGNLAVCDDVKKNDTFTSVEQEPDCTLDSVKVNTVGGANDTNGHSGQESDVTIDVENGNIDEPANGNPS